MLQLKRNRWSILALLTLGLASTAVSPEKDPDANFDRLDGSGRSGKKVNVIEWEGNLEIHVYPQGSLKGLSLKLDKKDKKKPVMVIGYRFDNDPKARLIRRAILTIAMSEGFKAYKDLSAEGYDKIIVSNNGLSSQVAEFKLDPTPDQLYPDEHPASQVAAKEKDSDKEKREPASKKSKKEEEDEANYDEDGTIRPFRW